MATDDSNSVGVRRGTRAKQLKNHQKKMIFAVFAWVVSQCGRLLGHQRAGLAKIQERGRPQDSEASQNAGNEAHSSDRGCRSGHLNITTL